MSTSAEFRERLASFGGAARSAAAAYLDDDALSPYLLTPAGDYLGRGGKGLRPALCLATCAAYGGREEEAMPSAAAIELVHTAMLVHDDVEDDSELRRGRPTLHRRYGRAGAINAGDGLAVVALGALRDNERLLGTRLASRVWSEFDVMARQTVSGQARELGWMRDGRTDLCPDDYLDLILQKTCWYTTLLPLRVGALIGSRGAVDLAAMTRFGFFLGAAFQIRDDVLNLVGSQAVYGKEALGDLREGKRTLVLIHLLAAAAPADRERVRRFLALPPAQRSSDQVEQIVALMHDHGSVAFADEFGRGIARAAAQSFEEAFAGLPGTPARWFVRDLVTYMVERDR
ncbi:polyprenyl synthetase family protein [Ornithinimicrobium pekingense]|uniref:Geranylgeranyl diphosphate synthetase n=1 Tax=Ornithinimicrobium pekingense TaxID=384677 RepID=A0ABQ2FCW1_9MICO|nr:polyprenyl synthetase family protein [Ornithinimicrobium pekingense]GGK75151.1 geranylgeranyl diphosphate synthetase [Ornithinimicrobium pekingense]